MAEQTIRKLARPNFKLIKKMMPKITGFDKHQDCYMSY